MYLNEFYVVCVFYVFLCVFFDVRFCLCVYLPVFLFVCQANTQNGLLCMCCACMDVTLVPLYLVVFCFVHDACGGDLFVLGR